MRADPASTAVNAFSAASPSLTPWHLDAIHAAAAQEISRGSGIWVALLDSGVDTDHPDLAGHLNLALARNFGDPDDPGNVEDGIGHGTAMAGLILQVAPAATIIPLKISAGSSSTFSNEALIKALEYLQHLKSEHPQIRVANLSLVVDEDGGEDEITAKIKDLVLAGVIIAVAAGNHGAEQVSFPANMVATLGVTAVDSQGNTIGSANYGQALAMSAPGIFIYAPTLHGDYAYMSGTSPATALISGSVALLSSLAVDNNVVLWALLAGSDDLHTPGHDEQSGFGSLDVGAAAREAASANKYSLPSSLILDVGEERRLAFAPAGAVAVVHADAPFAMVTGDGNCLTIRGLRPGNDFLTLVWPDGSREVPVRVGNPESVGAACRVGHFMYPRYCQQDSNEKLWGFYNLQCLESRATAGSQWTYYWEDGGYRYHCIRSWHDLSLDQGSSQGFLFPPVSMMSIAPGIYEMGLSFDNSTVAGSRSFFVNMY